MPDPFLSEIKYRGGASVDFIEVTVDAGTDVSDLTVTIYQGNGTVRSSNSLAGLVPTTQGNKDIYVIAVGTPISFNGVAINNGVALSDSSTVYSFVSFSDSPNTVTASEGPANGLTSSEIGVAGAGASLETSDGGITYSEQANPTPGSVPCLTKGARVTTVNGEIPVEQLRQGDLVLTFCGTYEPLRKIVRCSVTSAQMQRNPKLVPVRISAGSLGHGLPCRDLLVSRQHRMLVTSPIAQRMFGTAEVLIAAIKLTALPGIYLDEDHAGVEYFHLIFGKHEVVFAEGAPTESLLLGPGALGTIAGPVINEFMLMRQLERRQLVFDHPRFLVPTNARQKRLIERHAYHQRPVLSQFF